MGLKHEIVSSICIRTYVTTIVLSTLKNFSISLIEVGSTHIYISSLLDNGYKYDKKNI